MTMPDEYAEYDRPDSPQEYDEVTAPPPMPTQWSWSSNTLLWAAGSVLVLGFGVWFLMSYTGARARALVGGDENNDNS